MLRIGGQRVPTKVSLLLLSDALLIVLGLLIAVSLRFQTVPEIQGHLQRPETLPRFIVAVLVCGMALYLSDLYDFRVVERRSEIFVRLLQALGLACFALAIVYYLVPDLSLGRGIAAIAAPLILGLTLGWRVAVEEAGWMLGGNERVLIVGTGATDIALAREMVQRPELNLKVVGFLDERGENIGKSLVNPGIIGAAGDVEDIVAQQKINRVVLSLAERRGRLRGANPRTGNATIRQFGMTRASQIRPGITCYTRVLTLVVCIVSLTAYNALAQSPPPATASVDQGSQDAQSQTALNQAYALLRMGKLEEAVAAFKRVLESNPENRTVRLELGYLNGRLGRWREAIRYLELVSHQEPENLKLRLDLGYALQNLGELDRAAQEFKAVSEGSVELRSEAQSALDNVRSLQAAQAARAQAAREAQQDRLLNQGYNWLREGNRAAARQAFERALAEDPTNVTILKQIGYLALAEGNLQLAAERFESAWQLAPQDYAAALQLGFIYDRLHQSAKAEAAFRAALASPDPKTFRAARGALKNLPGVSLNRVYLDVFASPLYATRFSNGIANFWAQLHWRPRPDGPVTLYLGTRITRDSRSRGGNLPAIISDNAALLGAGVNVRPRGWNLNFQAEANLAFNLTQPAGPNRDVRPDYRAVLSYYRRWDSRLWGPIGALTFERLRGERLFTDLDTSLGYYSRYRDNVIGYLQLREGLRLANFGASSLAGYMVLNLAKDTNRDFYNNVGEVGAGLEFRPHRNLNLSLRAAYLRGIYYGIEGRDPNPFRPSYNDFRLTLFFGHRF